MKKNKVNFFEILRTIKNIIIIILIIILVINLCLWDNPNVKESIFNKIGAAVVVSDSMEPVLSINDLIVIKKNNNYKVGDIIVYKINNELIIHRIVRIEKKEIVTKGDANEYEDKSINLEKIYGKLYFSIPYVGGIIGFFKTNYGIFSIITLVIIMFIYSCFAELKVMAKK